MLPFRRRPSPKQAVNLPPPKPTPALPQATGLYLRHLDYNLQPLGVESLSHYIEPVIEGERFRVH